MFRNHALLCLALWLCSGFLWQSGETMAQSFGDEPPEFSPGLLASYQSPTARAERIDEDLLFNWTEGSVDERFEPGAPFSAHWTGWLQAKADGNFEIKVYGAAGTLKVRLNDQEIVTADLAEPRWVTSEPINLQYGRHAVDISYVSQGANARIGFYWSGPGFGLEPIAPRFWVHRTDSTPEQLFERGRTLSRGLRCAACHQFDASFEEPLKAPALTHLQDNLRPSWLVEHLTQGSPSSPDLSVRRMPYYALHRNDAAAISAALFAASVESATPEDVAAQLKLAAKKRGKKEPPVRTEADPERGAISFSSIGCLACHQVGDIGKLPNEIPLPPEHGIYAGGDLSKIAAKRTQSFFARLLADPATVNTQHRMPAFELDLNERFDLTAYLAALGGELSRNDTRASGDVDRGLGLIAKHRCAACHQLPQSLVRPIAKSRLSADSDWNSGCLTEPDPTDGIPGFGLTAEQKQALRVYVSSLGSSRDSAAGGADVLAELNCLGCHSRDSAEGISPHLPEVAYAYPQLAAKLAGLSPPAITGVGDKLTDQALRASIARDNRPLRPWLDVRMPKYSFSEGQLDTLVRYLIDHDRIPEVPGDEGPPLPSDTATTLAAARLVTSDGFGCQSCHAIGDMEAPEVDLKARGTNLAMPEERIRESWFHRWVSNPSRIVPRMEMPAIQTAVKGVLQDDLQLQLAALWKTLNTPDFRPPRPNPVRVVRNYNSPGLDEDAHVVTCVIEAEGKTFLRPLVFGLTNRHNVLYDLEAGELSAWWIGDTARQHTRGKTWYWEAGGEFLGADANFLERVVIIDAEDREWVPRAEGQFAVSLDAIERTPQGVRWRGRMHVSHQDQRREIQLSQTVAPSENGFTVQTECKAAAGDRVQLTTRQPVTIGNNSARFDVTSECHALLTFDACRLESGPNGTILAAPLGSGARLRWSSEYSTSLPADVFEPPPAVTIQNLAVKLDCVPGYEAIQLPLPREEMPISFAWGPTGQFYFGSLKGHVLQLFDDDQDGLHERYEVISDELPTPYGLRVHPSGLDVLAKFALLRLTPADPPWKKWNIQVVADGWGYTADYHDWAVGLEVDPQGNYYMALPCQQDDRTLAGAYLRGTALKLVPNASSVDRDRQYRIEVIAAGLRFPMGIARNSAGDIFTTDNQGNYNPFNELNHLRYGKRYGFINKLENKDGFSPPFESPAINLPHPWSRSVNGICFLRSGLGDNSRFGPFAGHLIGCEMNGRSLVRMSLQKVGDTYQGAAYAFSRPVSEDEPTFEGPIVCQVSPAGDLYVGSLQDSGWGGGNNTGSIVRLRPVGDLPTGIAEVRATSTGFEIDLTQPVDPAKASRSDNYQIRSYRRVSTPAYGGDDQDEKSERAQAIEVSADYRMITLRMDALREGCVYEINLAAIGTSDEPLFPNQAHYTLRSIPDR